MAAGQAIHGLPAHQIARLGLGYVPEDWRIFTDLTVLQNLEVGRQRRATGRTANPAPALDARGSVRAIPQPPQDAPPPWRGQRRRAADAERGAHTLMGQPLLVLLDEPRGAWPRSSSRRWRAHPAGQGPGVDPLSEQTRCQPRPRPTAPMRWKGQHHCNEAPWLSWRAMGAAGVSGV